MLKLLTVVCFATVAIGQVKIQYSPVIPKQEDIWSVTRDSSMYSADAPNHQQRSQCENSDVLTKILLIFSKLLDNVEVQKPRIEKVQLAIKLLKEYVESAPRSLRNDEVAQNGLTLEEAILKIKDIVPESKQAVRSIDGNMDTNDTVLTSSHRLLENVKNPNCIEELGKVIKSAQKSYAELIQSPICKDTNASLETVLRRSEAPFTLNSPANSPSQKQYKRANFNNIQNQQARNNEALKSSLGLLMNQSDYNAHDVFELLQNFKPIQPEIPPDAVEPVVNDSKPFNPNQTEMNSNLLASAYNASQASHNLSQFSDNVAINDWTNYNQATRIDLLNPNEIELTYALKRPQPLVYQPYYFIKYRLPFNSFLQNLEKATQMKSRDTSKSELYKSVIQSWNADQMSPDLAHYTKEQVNDLVMKEGNLVEALLIQSKDKNMRLNLNTPDNLQSQLSEYNVDKRDTKKVDGSPYYSSDHYDESRRRNVKSNIIRPGLLNLG